LILQSEKIMGIERRLRGPWVKPINPGIASQSLKVLYLKPKADSGLFSPGCACAVVKQ
jgi:hypothetical protein